MSYGFLCLGWQVSAAKASGELETQQKNQESGGKTSSHFKSALSYHKFDGLHSLMFKGFGASLALGSGLPASQRRGRTKPWPTRQGVRASVDELEAIEDPLGVSAFKAIAAMSLNRVIGVRGQIPWHLPEDFRWFKQTTTGQVVVMGRKTFESIGKALPNRTTVVLSRTAAGIAGARVVAGMEALALCLEDPEFAGRDVFICGGAEVYRQALPLCSDLYLTLVNRVVEGDTLFPPFEHLFEPVAEVLERAEFRVLHYRRRPG